MSVQDELDKFIIEVIKDDNDYFLKSRDEHGRAFITPEEHRKVNAWLEGKDDPATQANVCTWMVNDAEYVWKLKKALTDKYWYLPGLGLVLNDLARSLEDAAKVLC